jgi:hypothetical protein
MKTIILTAGLLISLLLCGTSKAQLLTGEQLQTKCSTIKRDIEDKTSTWTDGFCLGYISGILDSQSLWDYLVHVGKDYPQTHYCLPDEATNSQVVQVVLKFLNDHPERLHEPANTLILEALHNAFPCKAKP